MTSVWCPGCSRQVEEACHHFHCPVKPRPPHKVMTIEEYEAMPIKGWHEVCRDIDNAGNVGVRFLS